MKIEEKLNETQWLARRENAGWPFRVIVTTETQTNLEIGASYTALNPITNEAGKIKVESLCQVTAEIIFGEYDDKGDYDDYKEAVLELLRGDCTMEELREWLSE